MQVEPMHAARLAQLEGALCALLREVACEFGVNDAPDGITATLGKEGLDLEYRRGQFVVSGEGL